MVPGDGAPAVGGWAMGWAAHDGASGSNPYHVADVEDHTYQHVFGAARAASVTDPLPSPGDTAPLTWPAAADGPVSTPNCVRSRPEKPPLLTATSWMCSMALDRLDCACTA